MTTRSPDGSADPDDWTTGRAAISYQHCRICGNVWYFRRGFCPRCGGTEIDVRDASGFGAVYAATTVSRAPSEALRALAPYRIVMIDADEGFRLMAHGAEGLAIGDRVQARFERFGWLFIPLFEPVSS